MSEEHEKKDANNDSAPLDRRQFVKAGTTALAVAGLGTCVFGFRYLSSNVLYEPDPIVSVGRPERLSNSEKAAIAGEMAGRRKVGLASAISELNK